MSMEPGHRPLSLGLFSINCEGGVAITTAPERWRATWENNLNAARIAEERGLDFLLPIGRWKGWGGPSDFQGRSFETLTWATGILANTSQITVFATVHTPMIHPIVAAKQAVTATHVGSGRFGLNLVAGWNEDEARMFGTAQLEHDARYAYSQEWLDVVRLLWDSEEEQMFSGVHFDLPGLIGRPSPYGGDPLIVNAGFSSAGREFAARNCDYLFISLTDLESVRGTAESVKAKARALGRSIGIIGTAWVVCRPTLEEAEEFLRHYSETFADWEAAEALMSSMGLHSESNFPPGYYEEFRQRFVAGHGGYPLVGTPEMIADQLEHISDAGVDALAFGLVDYAAELPYFCDEVMPLLSEKGLREIALS